jgi:hypothetical protein
MIDNQKKDLLFPQKTVECQNYANAKIMHFDHIFPCKIVSTLQDVILRSNISSLYVMTLSDKAVSILSKKQKRYEGR